MKRFSSLFSPQQKVDMSECCSFLSVYVTFDSFSHALCAPCSASLYSMLGTVSVSTTRCPDRLMFKCSMARSWTSYFPPPAPRLYIPFTRPSHPLGSPRLPCFQTDVQQQSPIEQSCKESRFLPSSQTYSSPPPWTQFSPLRHHHPSTLLFKPGIFLVANLSLASVSNSSASLEVLPLKHLKFIHFISCHCWY